MSSKTRKRFEELFEKVSSHLKNKDETSLNELPSDCRLLRYWTEKLRKEEPQTFLQIKKEYMLLNSQVGQKLHDDYLKYLARAKKHRKGTKVRLKEILRYVYYYGNYVHECLLEGGAGDSAKKILRNFWDVFGKELMKYRDILDDFQINWILRISKESANLGIEIERELISALEVMAILPDPVFIERCRFQLDKARKNLHEEENITALVLADHILELLLRDLCTRFGCDEKTSNRKGRSFGKWSFTDYVVFLAQKGEIDKFEKANLFRFHEWRNAAHHHGMEPSQRIVDMVIAEIEEFLDQHMY